MILAKPGYIMSSDHNVRPLISGAEMNLSASVVKPLSRLLLAVKTRNLADDDKPLK